MSAPVPVEQFECRPSGDYDIALVCGECAETLCNVECGDTLETLLLVAIGHKCPPSTAVATLDLWVQ